MNIKKSAQEIIDTIQKNNGEAYLVGGCVRDLILGRDPNDYDIATNLLPKQLKKIFPKVINTGIKHLTVTVLIHGFPFEVTTYRGEDKYSDGRHPDNVYPAKTLEEDLSRRDFTINALATNNIKMDNIIDYFGGLDDIKNKKIQCVGETKDRFAEDKLRAIRAIRFASQLNFDLDKEIVNELKNVSLEQISRERIQTELIKILSTNNPDKAFIQMLETGLLKQIIPELYRTVNLEGGHHHNETVWEHCLLCLKESVNHTDDWRLRLTCLLHDVGKSYAYTNEDGIVHFLKHEIIGSEIAYKIMKRLKFSNIDIAYIKKMIRFHMSTYSKNAQKQNLSKKAIKKAVRNVGEKDLWDMMIINYCDEKANLKDYTISFEAFLVKRTIWYEWQEIKKIDSALKVTDLAVNGHDILKLGYKEKEIGFILNDMLDKVDSDNLLNNREELIKYAKNLRKTNGRN